MQKRFYLILTHTILFLFLVTGIYGESASENSSPAIDELLKGYVASDVQLQELKIKVQEAALAHQKTAIQYGLNVQFNSGSVSYTTGQGSFVNSISFSPSFTVEIPSLSNTEFTVSAPVSQGEITKTSVGVSLDLLPSSGEKNKLALEKVERAYLEACRNVENRLITVEIAFWNELKSLYDSAAAVSDAADELITQQITFQSIQAQGYAITSSKYRSTQMALKTKEHTLEEKKRLLQMELSKFSLDCGLEPDVLAQLSPLSSEIEPVVLLTITDFDSNTYKELESTVWTNQYNQRVRDNDTDFSLSFEGGFAHVNSTGENTVNAGFSASYKGVETGLGVSVPLDTVNKNPSLTFSLSWDLNSTKTESLSAKEKEYEATLEELSIVSAQKAYEENVQNKITEKVNLEWKLATQLEEYELYKELYADSSAWYDDGLISYTEFLQAKNNYEQSYYNLQIVYLERKVYNLEITKLFIGDDYEEQ
jgi:outer membrane protein TolC